MLADFQIRKALQDEFIAIDPFDDNRLNPVSYDLTLHPDYRRYRDDIRSIETRDTGEYGDNDDCYGLVPAWHPHTTGHTMPPSGRLLRPGEFLLACTVETLTLTSAMAARVEGKSSLGRLGVAVHITAGFIDPGFTGQITLEIANLAPVGIHLHPGMPIAQIVFEPVTPPEYDYSKTGHYQGQEGPTESRYRYRH